MPGGGQLAWEAASYLISISSFLGVGYVADRYLKLNQITYGQQPGRLQRLAFLCAGEEPRAKKTAAQVKGMLDESKGVLSSSCHVLCCFLGIQVSFTCWGLLQEQLMTQPYGDERWESSKFLVFSNRMFAMAAGYSALRWQRRSGGQRIPHVPFRKFGYASISNTLSSGCQYEALKYVSFTTQVVSKSCKMIPMMLMGLLVTGKRYSFVEYSVAVAITAGVAVFKLNEGQAKEGADDQTIGMLLLCGYLAFDAFTANWQSKLFTEYPMSTYQMMASVNTCSAIVELTALCSSLEIISVPLFIGRHPETLKHMCLMSLAACVGQLFIFTTIKRYGPLVFAAIMTVRQVVSLCLSYIVFHHPMEPMEAVGLAIIFSALFFQLGHKWCNKKSNKPAKQPPVQEEEMESLKIKEGR